MTEEKKKEITRTIKIEVCEHNKDLWQAEVRFVEIATGRTRLFKDYDEAAEWANNVEVPYVPTVEQITSGGKFGTD